ncbi:MAG: outer membrane protein assembly factor BamD [Wolinella sp.]
MKHLLNALIIAILLLFTAGCSQKNGVDEYNKPADYWYQRMLRDIRSGDLEGADSMFASLQSEHIHSPLVPEAMLILGRAHMDNQEYVLAEFYFEEFLKRYGSSENADFIGYLKLQANFFAFSRESINQQLLLDSINEVESYIKKHPYSRYKPYADTILLKLHLAHIALNREIARIYDIQDKNEAAEIYRNRIQYEWLKSVISKEPDIQWYRKIFNW